MCQWQRIQRPRAHQDPVPRRSVHLTNTPQFSWPDTAFGSTTFGVVSGTMNVGPRNVQFGLKVDF